MCVAAVCPVTIMAAIITAATAPVRKRNLSKIPMCQHHGPSVGPLHRPRPRLIQAAVNEAIASCRIRHFRHPNFPSPVCGTAVRIQPYTFNIGASQLWQRFRSSARQARLPGGGGAECAPGAPWGASSPQSEADAMRCNTLLQWIRAQLSNQARGLTEMKKRTKSAISPADLFRISWREVGTRQSDCVADPNAERRTRADDVEGTLNMFAEHRYRYKYAVYGVTLLTDLPLSLPEAGDSDVVVTVDLASPGQLPSAVEELLADPHS